MVLARYQQPVDQCKIAEFQLQDTCCPDPDLCDRTVKLRAVLDIYGHFQIGGVLSQQPASSDSLVAEISGGRPVEVGLGSCLPGVSFSGHLVIVYGFTDGTTFLVQDPHKGSMQINYDDLRTTMEDGCWKDTWTNLKP
jgi:hypothetical protein